MNEQIGQQLRQTREAQHISQAQAARDTLIRIHYLQALEAGDIQKIPSSTQARGFLRAYSEYLGLDAEALIGSLNGTSQKTEPIEENTPAQEASPAPSGSQADEIFQRIGQKLKYQRSQLGLTLEDVERHTHLRQRYLTALENGDLNNLPSPVQGRGMLKNYASFLGLDPDPVLMQFAEALQARLVVNQAATRANSPTRPREPARPARSLPGPLQRLFSGDLLAGALLSIVLISFIIWGAARIFTMQSAGSASPTVPSIAEVFLTTPSATASPEPPSTTPTVQSGVLPGFIAGSPTAETPGSIALPASQERVQVYVSVYQRAYMQV
ncbi:MAG TPA: helix-turn-helix domain-containing protein, partial [Anaerolineales bacterium]|nr:helix-turn-helix domain-containing protein [Anaerolineales bacterium]